ncbi:tRNA lysidine(34) synthetase TilS [Limosilactobacillus secaliphilus]|nr:tRNA lysidine(34) synthetase TilS [Limosilactobacillus secaliphilus]
MAPLVMHLKRCLSGCRFFAPEATVVVAVSTGVDSMTLLTALQDLLPASQIVVAHVNHHLRAQSLQEEQYLRAYCQEHGLRLAVDEWQKHPEHGLEAAGRAERYRFFKKVLQKSQSHILLLAHQRDELFETIMMQLLRGGRIEQLTGIQPARNFDHGRAMILRPWLDISKADLIAFAHERSVKWFEDVTNHQEGTLRNRFRNRYIPELLQENPGLVDHVLDYRSQLADLLAIKNAYLDDLWPRLIVDEQLQLKFWETLSQPVQRAVLNRWLDRAGVYRLGTEELATIHTWLVNPEKPSGHLKINAQNELIKNYSTAKIQNVPELVMNHEPFVETVVKFGHWKRLRTAGKCLVSQTPLEKQAPVAEIWLRDDQLPLKWRLARSKDQLRLKNGGHQSVRRLLINAKIARAQRAEVVVLADAHDEVLWVPGVKSAWLDRKSFATQPAVVAYLYRRKRIQK